MIHLSFMVPTVRRSQGILEVPCCRNQNVFKIIRRPALFIVIKLIIRKKDEHGFSAIVIAAGSCDDVFSDNTNFMQTTHRSDLQSFHVANDRIICFHQRKPTCHKKAWHVVKMLLVLSHGHATVKSGFSITNK